MYYVQLPPSLPLYSPAPAILFLLTALQNVLNSAARSIVLLREKETEKLQKALAMVILLLNTAVHLSMGKFWYLLLPMAHVFFTWPWKKERVKLLQVLL